jgi:hypothetical protein
MTHKLYYILYLYILYKYVSGEGLAPKLWISYGKGLFSTDPRRWSGTVSYYTCSRTKLTV